MYIRISYAYRRVSSQTHPPPIKHFALLIPHHFVLFQPTMLRTIHPNPPADFFSEGWQIAVLSPLHGQLHLTE